MKIIVLILTAAVVFTGCNEAGRGNDSNRGEDRTEAAAESNQDKFVGETQKDAAFVFDVVQSNYAEIKLSELGNQRSRDQELKKIAQAMLSDHTTALNDLKTLAQAKAISVPVEETVDARKNLQDMAEESDEDFDRAWCQKMMDVHDKSIERFQKRLENTEDAELKAYIQKILPVLKKHHESLQAYNEKLERSNS